MNLLFQDLLMLETRAAFSSLMGLLTDTAMEDFWVLSCISHGTHGVFLAFYVGALMRV
jgi:hypothetical protein